MSPDDTAGRESALREELATAKADAASVRKALAQETHVAAVALETSRRLRRERDEARAAAGMDSDDACDACMCALRAEVETLRAWQRTVAAAEGWCEALGEDIPEAEWLADVIDRRRQKMEELEGQLAREKEHSRTVSDGAAAAIRERADLRLQCQELSKLVEEERELHRAGIAEAQRTENGMG